VVGFEYLDACVEWMNRYSRRLGEVIKKRISDREFEFRDRTCVEIEKLLDLPDLATSFGSLEKAIRNCASEAFLHLYNVVSSEVIEQTRPAEYGSPTTR